MRTQAFFLLLLLVALAGCTKPRQPRRIEQLSSGAAAVQTPPVRDSAASAQHDHVGSIKTRPFIVGQVADLRLASRVDTILEVVPYGGGPATLIPLERTFRVEGFLFDATTNDSLFVVTEQLKAFHKGDWGEKTDGDAFVVHKGVVALAETLHQGVERDSTLGVEFSRGAFVHPVLTSHTLLILSCDASPAAPPSEDFNFYGIGPDGVLREFPGLGITSLRDLPTMQEDNVPFLVGTMFACVYYKDLYRFDPATYSFAEVPSDSGYEAESDMTHGRFFDPNDTAHVAIYRTPSANAEREVRAFTGADSLKVVRFLEKDGHWVLLTRKGKRLGWIDEAGMNELQLTACG